MNQPNSDDASILSLLYVSSATQPFSRDDLVELLRVSRQNNEARGISGMLLHRDGNFIQVLEGPPAAVEERFERIRRDERHAGILVLLRQEIGERQFGHWSMGFRSLEELSPEDAAYFTPFLNGSQLDEAFRSSPSRAHQLLAAFKRAMR